MAEIIFHYDGRTITIQCDKNQKMKDICNNFSNKINMDVNSLLFLCGGNKLNLDCSYNEISKENKLNILVYKDESEICSKCGRIINNKLIDEIILLNNNLNYTLIGLKSQIDNIINDINTKKDEIYITSQLKNINLVINNINEDFKKMNIQLNQIKFNFNQGQDNANLLYNDNKTINNALLDKQAENKKIENKNNDNIHEDIQKKNNQLKSNNPDEGNFNSTNNEIICIYNKNQYRINLLNDFNMEVDLGIQKIYQNAKDNINEKNIEIYINDIKINFDYKYKSKERGEIKVKFKLNNLLTSSSYMFYRCPNLKSIDLSSFNTSKINEMRGMFSDCSSLESINLSSLDTSNVNNMSFMFNGCCSLKSLDLTSINTFKVNYMDSMFNGCTSLESINLSSFNTVNAKDMKYMFNGCSSLKSIDCNSFETFNVNSFYAMFQMCSSLKSLDLTSFNTINVKNMNHMFWGCSSLESIDLSSFNAINVEDMDFMFSECSSLKKENIKINPSQTKILDQLKKLIN